MVADAVDDGDFVDFLERAIVTELANLAELRERAHAFPIEEIGVAQGNSLSPLVGNLLFYHFDEAMNEGDCACFRYIDDFIILSPTAAAANSRLKKARQLLGRYKMELAVEKTSQAARDISKGIDFLGIQICPGLIRPSSAAQGKLLAKVTDIFERGRTSLVASRDHAPTSDFLSCMATLRLASTTIDGWSKHYWFCNDNQAFASLDAKIWKRARAYLACYSDVRGHVKEESRPKLLGLAELKVRSREPFAYPRTCEASGQVRA